MQKDAAALRILNNADVVFSTLAFTGSAVFKKVSVPFDTVVIDEAAQALEPSCLVPLTGSVKQARALSPPLLRGFAGARPGRPAATGRDLAPPDRHA